MNLEGMAKMNFTWPLLIFKKENRKNENTKQGHY